jgi:hypothetical protein
MHFDERLSSSKGGEISRRLLLSRCHPTGREGEGETLMGRSETQKDATDRKLG